MNHFDVIVIGSGPGGASVAQRLAPTGKRILVLERGNYLKREAANWDTDAVFNQGRYKADETWYGTDGAPFNPMVHYVVGGNSKVYGAALVRLRREDFDEVQHAGGGISPAWPLPYDVFDPYYLEAEKLFHVHGARGEDPSEPNAATPFPFQRIEHEPRIRTLSEAWARQGLRPFHLPLGILLDQKDGSGAPRHDSACVRCSAFDGFPCLTNGKADSQIVCVDPTLRLHPNVTLRTNARVDKLETDAGGRTIAGVNVTRDGARERYSADIVVVACGSINSALLLLRSANSKHPNGLANTSDQVGRNYMRHNQSVMVAFSRARNDTTFQKTLALSDFYFGTKDWPYPMGFVQMCGKLHAAHLRGDVLQGWSRLKAIIPYDALAHHAVDLWLSSEDLPAANNRVTIRKDGTVQLALSPNNLEAHARLVSQTRRVMQRTSKSGSFFDRTFCVRKWIPIEGVSHQAGTLRFGADPKTSVLDTDCKAHELDNLYVTDASFFPSVGAVNPTLTIIANALRVADHIKVRLDA